MHIGRLIFCVAFLGCVLEPEPARAQADATHKLGLIALEAGNREEAVKRFQQALEAGLTMPTLRDLGRAYEPEETADVWTAANQVARAEKSAGYYARAFDETRDADLAALAGRQYLLAFDWARKGQELGALKEYDIPGARKRAVEWLNKAMDLGSAKAWTNFGALLYSDGNYTEARPAFERGAKADNAVAHQYLGMMAERDGGDFLALSLAHYERALALGHAPARDDVNRLLLDSLRYEPDLEIMGRGIARLKELQQEGDENSRLDSIIVKYNWKKFLTSEKQRGRRLPDLPIYLKACELERKFNPAGIQDFSYWTLHMASAELSDPLAIQGTMDRTGCARIASPLAGNIRTMINSGGVTFLRFYTGTLVLDWQVRGKQIHLVPRPLNEQLDIPLM